MAQHEATQSADTVPASLWGRGNRAVVVPRSGQLGAEQERGCLPVLFGVPQGTQQDAPERTGTL